MRFKTNKIYKNRVQDAFEALAFLRERFQEGNIADVENMDDVLDALDISGDLEYAQQKLKEFHIEY